MKMKNLFILMFFNLVYVSILTDCYSFDDDYYSDPQRDKLLKKIPKILKRSYNIWNSKDTCTDHVIRSTSAKARPTESEWFTFNARMPRLVTPLLKSQILLEFHEVKNMAQVRQFNYTIDVRPLFRNTKSRRIKLKKLISDNELAEFYFNITSIHSKLMLFRQRYMRLRYRVFVTKENVTQIRTTMPFQYKKMKAFLITFEENKNCSLDILTMNAKKLLDISRKRAMLRTMERLSLYPVNDNSFQSCRLTDWYVSFSQIGWSSFVVAPSVINARACSGTCAFPLLANATRHSLLQAAVANTAGIKTSVCCVPLTIKKTNLIFYDDYYNTFTMGSENLIATSCGCH